MFFSISVSVNNNLDALEYIEQTLMKYSDCEKIEWTDNYKSNIQIDEQNLIKAFEDIVRIYDSVWMYATSTYDVREGDGSADWWGTTTIQTERVKGKTTVRCSSSTGWN